MKKLFENGYLKPEYINPNYRGLVGWPHEMHDRKIIAINNDNVMVSICDTSVSYGNISYLRIPQFTPSEIPIGELCWCLFQGYWYLKVYDGVISNDPPVYKIRSSSNHYKVVPYIIAETAEKAQWICDNTDFCRGGK